MPDPLPLRAALWLAAEHPDYFHQDARPWLRRTSWPARGAVWALDRLLTRAWIRRALEGAPGSPVAFALHAARAAQAALINQREHRAEIREGIHDGHFWLSTAARLVRGQVNCEGQNHALGLLLSRRLPEVELFETRRPGTGESCHTLVRVKLGGRWVMVDAWSDAPLFHLEASWPDAPAELRSLEELRARGLGAREGLQPRVELEAGRGTPVTPRLGRLLRLIHEPDEPPPPPGSVGPDDPGWQRYLVARSHHVYGAPADAAAMYEELVRRDPRSPVGEMASRWLSRVQKSRTESV